MNGQSSAWSMPRAAVFVEIVSAGSITAAARRLRLSKSVVSTHLKELEELCGARLLERTTRRQRLTDIGERFLPHARAMVEAWADGLDEVVAATGEPRGTLRVTAPLMIDATLVTPAVARIASSYPQLSVEIDLSESNRDLIEDEFDVAIRMGPLPDSTLQARRLGADRDVLVASPDLVRTLGSIDRPEQLLDAPWIAHARLPARRRMVGPAEERLELEARPRIRVNSSGCMLQLLRTGMGVALFPWSLTRPEVDAGRLVRVLPQWHGGIIPIHAVWTSGKFISPKIRCFVDILAEVMTDREAESAMTGHGLDPARGLR